MKFRTSHMLLVALTASWFTSTITDQAAAQCATCAVPTVAYSPVAYQPAVAYQPYYTQNRLRWRDRVRLRRYERAAYRAGVAPYSVGYAPYTAAYATTAAYTPYTAAYTPYSLGYPSYTAAYRPYVTAYAPLVPAGSVGTCAGCTQTAYYAAAVTVARPVAMSPVVASACSTCSYDPCSCSTSCSTCGCNPCSCSTCDSGVSQAIYSEPGCTSCAGAAVPEYSMPGTSVPSVTTPEVGPSTPRPELRNKQPAPADSIYHRSHPVEAEEDPLHSLDPIPEGDGESSTYIEPPKLFMPGDRTAERGSSTRPTVDVRKAIYQNQVDTNSVSQSSRKPGQTRGEIDAVGWSSVSRSR